ncbi:pyruvate kinase [Tetragenococcus halophilus]|uniref:Pyruvate kinase n=1 Tax=Tetragenococcus halophilus (strain DSM 20338 / JCM 20259 / NCIMB 9735 / NBRC 12172) TaxID=945021 RepID=A0AAN1SFW9_TETHN|nr:pyruvate kinase [Tetragenococcus halophilus]AOF49329.1 pyruvate kinase [Tetragenococcus halophilus]MCO7027308.1 pyruvate kinase [Tetragenococcus halophilus]NWO00673.1 pyruvate kinase [Tetragenococcus halophilus]QXN86270.1 pyruvate kinase [Tetragenococcus halophilus]RQD29213.1 pyruvate kinase [Tetragenococcus halophilus subsp. halophilus DSM 20339]
MKKTKIVSTLGPASNSVDTIAKLIEAGANVFRFNFSHGDHDEHLDRMDKVHQAVERTGIDVGILLDTKGAEIRTTAQATETGKIPFEIGDRVRIAMDAELEGTKDKISVTYEGLFDDVHEGGHVLFDDGLIDMLILEKDESNRELVTEVQNPGILGSRKGVNAPGVSISLPGITDKDADDIRFGLQHNINYIAASFVRKAQDVLDIREILEETGMTHVQIFPKIESQEGIDNIDEILKVSDGIMVARGDMGVEIPSELVPMAQKNIIKKCNAAGKSVITATQMLESMQENPRPTRAEASDVANAVFDGTDATMLSGESANGSYPVEAVTTMARIDVEAEKSMLQLGSYQINQFDKTDVTETIGLSVARAAKNLGVKCIVAATESGHTAKMISKYRPDADILAVTFDDHTKRGLMLNWGVYPTVTEKPETTDDMFELATKKTLELGFAKEGDSILITAGVPVGERGTTNVMKIQMIGSKLIEAQGVGDHSVVANTVVAKNAEEAVAKAKDGMVLVVPSTDKEYMPAIEKAAALVVEESGLTSHAAVVGVTQDLPVIVGAKDALNIINDGELVTIDSRRGIVYRGETMAV